MAFDPRADYPLGLRRPELVTTPGGVPLTEVTLAAVQEGRLDVDEMRATSETLERQAEVAAAAGRPALAANLARAAELARVPAELILEVYTALRPHRATAERLEAWARQLEDDHAAPRTAAFVREAATVYAQRGLLAEAP